MKIKSEKTHHHGDLKEALIKAGITLLNEGGLHTLTLRKCAAKAGVSHAAPAHHFSGLQGLITAISERGMAMFAQTMQQEIDSVSTDPFEKLYAMCNGYLLFAIENPALAQLMFNHQSNFERKKNGGRNANVAFNILTNTCEPFKLANSKVRGKTKDKKEIITIQFAVWSLIHGFTQLHQLGQINKKCDDPPIIDFSDILSTLNLELIEPV
jgi:hypothetical protein